MSDRRAQASIRQQLAQGERRGRVPGFAGRVGRVDCFAGRDGGAGPAGPGRPSPHLTGI